MIKHEGVNFIDLELKRFTGVTFIAYTYLVDPDIKMLSISMVDNRDLGNQYDNEYEIHFSCTEMKEETVKWLAGVLAVYMYDIMCKAEDTTIQKINRNLNALFKIFSK